MTPAVDKKTRTIYFVVGNPSPDLYGAIRPGDNLYTDSIVAVDLDTGAYKAHFQYIAHDVWDLDAVSAVILTEAKDQSGKMVISGDSRRQDRPRIRAQPQRPVARPLLRSNDPAGEHVGAANGHRCTHAPGTNGGVEWSPMAINPKLRMAYAANLHQPMTYHVEASEYPGGNSGWVAPSRSSRARSSGVAWRRSRHGQAAWKADTEQPLIGGVLATGGNSCSRGRQWQLQCLRRQLRQKLWSFHAARA